MKSELLRAFVSLAGFASLGVAVALLCRLLS